MQTSAGIINVAKLGVRALGNVTLDGATNTIANIAVEAGDASNANRNVRVKSTGTLNIGAGIDGLSGITVHTTGSYNSASPDGLVSSRRDRRDDPSARSIAASANSATTRATG